MCASCKSAFENKKKKEINGGGGSMRTIAHNGTRRVYKRCAVRSV